MKTVLITGTGKGIGVALAKEFLDADWRVVGTYRSTKPILSHDNYHIYQSDVSNPADNAELVKTLKNMGIHLDVLINNAAIACKDKAGELSESGLSTEKLQEVVAVNLIGLANLTEQALELMAEDGHIINVSSQMGAIDGSVGSNWPSYRISKAAVNMYTRTLAARIGDDGPTVSAIHPGRVNTDMGGAQAPMSPEDAGKWIFEFSTRKDVPTGKFWHKGEELSW